MSSPAVQIVSTCLLSAGLMGNCALLAVLLTYPIKSYLTQRLMIAQSVLDLLNAVRAFLETHANLFASTSEAVCIIFNSKALPGALATGSAICRVLLAYDRYMVVCQPTTCKNHRVRRMCVCMGILAVSMLEPFTCISLTMVMRDGHCVDEERVPNVRMTCAINFFTVGVVLPIVSCFYFYIRVALVMGMKWRVAPAPTATPTPAPAAGAQQLTATAHQSTKVIQRFTLTCLLLTVYFCCTNPVMGTFILLFSLHFVSFFTEPLASISILLMTSNMCIHPFTYFLVLPEFQRKLKKLILCTPCRGETATKLAGTSVRMTSVATTHNNKLQSTNLQSS